jgi:hypothetical protein
VILVLTKFDLVVSQVLLDRFSGAPQYIEGARASAHTMYEEFCRHMFDKEPRDVPAEIVSGMYSFHPVLSESADILDHSQRKENSVISSII